VAATLHIEVFLSSRYRFELDDWMESDIYPALADVPGLDSLLTLMVPQGFDYQRDDAMGLWTSADMKYSITYEM
jgi:hypothetical protein